MESTVKRIKIQSVFRENLKLFENGLAVLTWGNVSGIDREKGYAVIKPSGVDYDKMTADDMAVVDLEGNLGEGPLKPSSDTPTHLYLYKAFPDIGGIVHTHSVNATAFAQAGRPILPLGTTHADAFFGPVPCTRALTSAEAEHDYELNTGKVIAETFNGKDYNAIQAVLVKNHGPFIWGGSPKRAVEKNAVTLEAVAVLSLKTLLLNPSVQEVPLYLIQRLRRLRLPRAASKKRK